MGMRRLAAMPVVFWLGGCMPVDDPMPGVAPERTGSVADEEACVAAVRAETGRTVTVLASAVADNGEIGVTLHVGPELVPWGCYASGGIVRTTMPLWD